jgi:hypothetical protein
MNVHGPEIGRNIQPLYGYQPTTRRKATAEVDKALFTAIRPTTDYGFGHLLTISLNAFQSFIA